MDNRKTAAQIETLRQDNEWFDQRREREAEMMAGNPEREERPAPLTKRVESIVMTCAHKGCDHVLTDDERYPGYLCDDHYWLPENRRFRWEKN